MFGIEFDENFSIFELEPFIFNNGLPLSDDDLGVGEWNDNGLNHLFKVPTLRNISLTAPYMHDGSIQSLAEVVEFYSSKTEANEWSIFIQDGGYGFNNNEKLALLAFLNTLTDETFINDVKFSDPFKITETVDPGPEPEFGNLVVKPNPMGDFAIIEFTTKADIETELTIVNNVGQEILKDIILGNTYELNKANFDSGIYYLTFKQEGKSKMQKLIVQ